MTDSTHVFDPGWKFIDSDNNPIMDD